MGNAYTEGGPGQTCGEGRQERAYMGRGEQGGEAERRALTLKSVPLDVSHGNA